MAEYSINKGIGKPAEFRGLKSQYLFIFSGGLLSVFIVFVIMYMLKRLLHQQQLLHERIYSSEFRDKFHI